MNEKKFKYLIYAVILIIVFGSCSAIDNEYFEEIDNFRTKRINFLQSRQGYMNLVGLYWIFEGIYTIGSNKRNGIVLPDNFPNYFGSMHVAKDFIEFTFTEEVLLDSTVSIFNYKLSKSDLDHSFSWNDLEWYIIKNGKNLALRVKDFNSPLIKKINEIPIFKPRKSWRIAAKFKSYEEISERVIENIWGHQVTQPTAGIVSFEHKGNTYELESNIESGKLAVIFKDQSSGKQTYHGGRQVYLTDPDENGNVIIDFNKSFNFPCAYNDFTTCPVPPQRNTLPFQVDAGEQYERVKS